MSVKIERNPYNKYSVIKNYLSDPYGYDDFCDQDEDNKTLINFYSDNLVECIEAIDLDIKFDNKKYKEGSLKFENHDNWHIQYELIIYKYKDCGWSDRITIYECEINIEDEYGIPDSGPFRNYVKKDKLFDIFKKETCNIKKKINNCKNSDNIKFKKRGNISYKYIKQLLNEQDYKCFKCDGKVITHLYEPYCLYQFSIDRLNNKKPHNEDNIKISCYFCNCQHHPKFDKERKIKCNNECFCNNDLYQE